MTASVDSPAGESTVNLVVNDEAVRDALGRLLTSAGYRVAPFGSGLIFLAGKPSAASACVVADIRTPGMDGLQLQEQLVARGLDLPLVIMTGQDDVPLAIRAMRVGASDFLEKPVDEPRLLESVENALLGGNRISESQIKATLDATAKLTSREKEVLDLLVTGCTDQIIARRLTISPPTVGIHRGRIMEKMKARNAAELVRNVLAATRGR